MEHQKILNLLNEASDSKFVTRNWNIVNDFSDANYSVGHETIYSTKVLKSHLCDYNYVITKNNYGTCQNSNSIEKLCTIY